MNDPAAKKTGDVERAVPGFRPGQVRAYKRMFEGRGGYMSHLFDGTADQEERGTPHSLSTPGKAGQSVSFWLHAPLVVAFNSAADPEDEEAEVYACLAYDYRGDELISKAKKAKESTFYAIDVELKKANRKWGGFRDRRKYLESV